MYSQRQRPADRCHQCFQILAICTTMRPWDWQKSKKVTWLVVCYAMKFGLSPVQVEVFSQSCSQERTLLLRGITEHQTTEGQITKLIVQHGNCSIWQSHLRVEAESKLLSDWLSPDVLPSSEVSSSQFGLWSSRGVRGWQHENTVCKYDKQHYHDYWPEV